MRVPLVQSKIEVTLKGTAAKAGLAQVRVDTDYFKSWVHERIRWPTDARGGWHLPHDTSDDYCAQIVSEARIRLPSGRVQWKQTSRENHFLDCESMQAAGAHMLNVARIPDMRTASAPAPAAQPVDPATETVEGGVPATPPSPSWLTGGPRPVRHSLFPDPNDSANSWVMNGRRWGNRWG